MIKQMTVNYHLLTYKKCFLTLFILVTSLHVGTVFGWSPGSNWRDSYAVGDQCYCDSSNYDHELDTKSARTPVGMKNVVEICSDIKSSVIGEGPSSGRVPYNDIQCGNGPANNAADERGCPGRVDQGDSGCNVIGPRWNLEKVYGDWPQSCSASRQLTQNQWYMVSLPCDVSLAGEGSVREVLADDLGEDGLGSLWTIYELGSDGNYRELSLDSELLSGVGYWLTTSESGKVMQIEGEFPIEIDVPLTAQSTQGAWNMIGTPFSFPVLWKDVMILDTTDGEFMSISSASSGIADCIATPISSSCRVAPRAFKWTEDESYETLDLQAGGLEMFDAAWVLAVDDSLSIRVPMPANEVNISN